MDQGLILSMDSASLDLLTSQRQPVTKLEDSEGRGQEKHWWASESSLLVEFGRRLAKT